MISDQISLVSMPVSPGNPEENIAYMLKKIEEKKERGAQIIVFPELCVSGYMLGDMWRSNAFVQSLVTYNQSIIEASNDITIVWGNVAIDEQKTNPNGSIRKYNAAYIASNGTLLGTTYKTHLPSYGEFYDCRHFTSNRVAAEEKKLDLLDCITSYKVPSPKSQVPSPIIGLTICEDLWHTHHGLNIAQVLKNKGAEIIINIACSPWHTKKQMQRQQVMCSLFPKGEEIPVYFCNASGLQDCGKTLLYLDGNSTVYNKNQATEETDVHDALVESIRIFFKRTGNKNALIGISGGIDSAVSAALLTEALGPDRVYGVNLSTKYNSEQTKTNARCIAKNLGIHYAEHCIDDLIDQQINIIESIQFQKSDSATQRLPTEARAKVGLSNVATNLSGFDKENIQSRARGSSILSALAAAHNALIICNGNKTEFAFGYATLYGDILGAIAPLGDLLKGDVYNLARAINKKADAEIIPEAVFSLPPSAELSAEQSVDEGNGDPFWYPYHDQLVRLFVEEHRLPQEILEWYRDGLLIERLNMPFDTPMCHPECSEPKRSEGEECIEGDTLATQGDTNQGISLKKFSSHFPTEASFTIDLQDKWKRLQQSVFKRLQAPPIIKMQPRSFGFDVHETQNGYNDLLPKS